MIDDKIDINKINRTITSAVVYDHNEDNIELNE